MQFKAFANFNKVVFVWNLLLWYFISSLYFVLCLYCPNNAHQSDKGRLFNKTGSRIHVFMRIWTEQVHTILSLCLTLASLYICMFDCSSSVRSFFMYVQKLNTTFFKVILSDICMIVLYVPNSYHYVHFQYNVLYIVAFGWDIFFCSYCILFLSVLYCEL